MKKVLYICLLMLAVLTSCRKEDVTESTFAVRLDVIHSSDIRFRVYPQYNDFYYTYGAISVKDYQARGEQYVIDSIYNSLYELYEVVKQMGKELGFSVGSFQETMLNTCACIAYEVALQPETDYYLCLIRIDKNLKPIRNLHKTLFTTKPYVHSDITFELTSNGSEVIVTPSNNDSYYWDFLSKKECDQRYYSSPLYFLSCYVEQLELYDLINTVLSVGKDSDNVADYYTLKPNDTLYLATAGYLNEINSSPVEYELIWNGSQFSIKDMNAPSISPLKTSKMKVSDWNLLRKYQIIPSLQSESMFGFNQHRTTIQ